MQGKFITFEGGEGAGKSTQIALLRQKLEQLGLSVLQTREPGGSTGAEAIRQVILSGQAKSFGPAGEALLFSAARIDHIDQMIAPALKSGHWVLCDRFADSTRAYQGALGNLDTRVIRVLETVTLNGLTPDLTLILDLSAEQGLARANTRRGHQAKADRFEAESLDFHRALRSAFLDIATSEPERCIIVDAARDIDTIARDIFWKVRERFHLGDKASAKGQV